MSGPLAGKRLLITRAEASTRQMEELITSFGGEAVVSPVLAFKPLPIGKKDQKLLSESGHFEWMVFTSGNGVRYFMDRKEQPLEVLKSARIAAVGTKTAQVLKDYGLTVSLIPDTYTAEDLATAMIKSGGKGQNVLLLLGQLAKSDLEKDLRTAGFKTHRLNVYETLRNNRVKPQLTQIINEANIDVVTFTSSSSVNFFKELTANLHTASFWEQATVACLGSVTAEQAQLQGLNPIIIPNTFTTPSLIQAIVDHYSRGTTQ